MPVLQNCVEELRKEQGLSLRQLERISGVPRSTIESIQQGREPGVGTALALCRALGKHVEEVFWFEEV